MNKEGVTHLLHEIDALPQTLLAVVLTDAVSAALSRLRIHTGLPHASVEALLVKLADMAVAAGNAVPSPAPNITPRGRKKAAEPVALPTAPAATDDPRFTIQIDVSTRDAIDKLAAFAQVYKFSDTPTIIRAVLNMVSEDKGRLDSLTDELVKEEGQRAALEKLLAHASERVDEQEKAIEHLRPQVEALLALKGTSVKRINELLHEANIARDRIADMGKYNVELQQQLRTAHAQLRGAVYHLNWLRKQVCAVPEMEAPPLSPAEPAEPALPVVAPTALPTTLADPPVQTC